MAKSGLRLRGSLRWAIFGSLLFLSIVPTVILTFLSVDHSSHTLTTRMQENLQVLAQARADDIDNQLSAVMDRTTIAADQVAVVLKQPVPPDVLATQLSHYQPDQRNIMGLDVYYNANGGEAALGTNLSNVFWNYRFATDSTRVTQEIVQTEALDPIFASIKSLSPYTQWIYFTSSSGMMRLYPWADNDHYPDGWDPRQIIFYTVAEPSVNPDLSAKWTPPYIDFAGAGLMTTLSIPVTDPETHEFMGIMSHDITISSLRDIALDTRVLDGTGYGFLIDNKGVVIAHPTYGAEDARQGELVNTNLLESGPTELKPVVQAMTLGQSGIGSYRDENNDRQLVVYAPVKSIGWSLGVVVPETAVLAPTMALRTRELSLLFFFILAAIVVAWWLSRLLHRPLQQLLLGFESVASGQQEATVIDVDSFQELTALANAFNSMSAQVWKRESTLKATVAELRIEVDIQRSQREIESIVETDYFKQLEVDAERLRNRLRQSGQGIGQSTHPSNP